MLLIFNIGKKAYLNSVHKKNLSNAIEILQGPKDISNEKKHKQGKEAKDNITIPKSEKLETFCCQEAFD